MSDFCDKNVPNSILAGAPPQTPFRELTAILRLWGISHPAWLHLKGPTFKGRRGKGMWTKEKRKVGKFFSPPPSQIDASDCLLTLFVVIFLFNYWKYLLFIAVLVTFSGMFVIVDLVSLLMLLIVNVIIAVTVCDFWVFCRNRPYLCAKVMYNVSCMVHEVYSGVL